MRKLENNCYGCPRPCAGCGRSHMEVRICDDCCDAYAEYVVDGDDLCEDCLKERLRSELQDMLHDVNKGCFLRTTAEQLGYNVEVL